MLRIYTKSSYIKKLDNDLIDLADENQCEVAFLEGYYDGLKENVNKKIIPIIIKWDN